MTTQRNRWIGLSLAHILLGGCVTSVHLAPRSFAWSEDQSEALWRSEGLEVATRLNTEEFEFPMRGIVRSERPGTSVSFETSGASGTESIGEIIVDGKAEPIVAGAFYPIPDGADAGAEFGLRSDAPWPDPPAVDSPVTYVLVLHDGMRTERCPFRFRVESTSKHLAPEARVAALMVIIPVFLVVLVCGGLARTKTNWNAADFRLPGFRMH